MPGNRLLTHVSIGDVGRAGVSTGVDGIDCGGGVVNERSSRTKYWPVCHFHILSIIHIIFCFCLLSDTNERILSTADVYVDHQHNTPPPLHPLPSHRLIFIFCYSLKPNVSGK